MPVGCYFFFLSPFSFLFCLPARHLPLSTTTKIISLTEPTSQEIEKVALGVAFFFFSLLPLSLCFNYRPHSSADPILPGIFLQVVGRWLIRPFFLIEPGASFPSVAVSLFQSFSSRPTKQRNNSLRLRFSNFSLSLLITSARRWSLRGHACVSPSCILRLCVRCVALHLASPPLHPPCTGICSSGLAEKLHPCSVGFIFEKDHDLDLDSSDELSHQLPPKTTARIANFPTRGN